MESFFMRMPAACVASLLGLTLIVSCKSDSVEESGGGKPSTVDFVDLKRYTGRWYEIAKIPNWFQKKCAGETTAEYSMREDGRLDVLNRCVDRDGKTRSAKGIARVTDETSNAKLKVSFVRIFGLSLFWGDYWIVGLGDQYEYAIIGTPNRKYGWILARARALAPEKLELIRRELRDQGYNPDAFESTRQARSGEPATDG